VASRNSSSPLPRSRSSCNPRNIAHHPRSAPEQRPEFHLSKHMRTMALSIKTDIPLSACPRRCAPCPRQSCTSHIEGSLEPEQMFALGQRNGVTLRLPQRAGAACGLCVLTTCRTSSTSTTLAPWCCKTEQDFYDMACAYLARGASRQRDPRRTLLRHPDPAHRPRPERRTL